MSLADLIRKVHGSAELSAAIDIFISGRLEEDRSDSWHPSAFRGMCPRREIILYLSGGLAKELPSPRNKRIWDVGSAIHSWYQNKYLGPMGILWGKWKCTICNEISWGFMPVEACVECGRYSAEYKEVPIKAALPVGKKNVIGHSDGLLNLTCGWTVFELKSSNSRIFSQLYIDHDYVQAALKQGQIYSELICQGMVDAPDYIKAPLPTKLLVMYVNKDTSEEKEFLVDLDGNAAKQELQGPIKYEKAIIEKEIPSKWDECTDITKAPASMCPVKMTCFRNDISWDSLFRKRNE